MKSEIEGNYSGNQVITVGIRTTFREGEETEGDGIVDIAPEQTRSLLEEVKLILAVDDPLLRNQMFDSQNNLTDIGSEAITNTLVAGLVEQIISCDLAGARGWHNHFDYVLSALMQGLAHKLPKGTINLDAVPNDPDQYEPDQNS